jgi:hypothetical protein
MRQAPDFAGPGIRIELPKTKPRHLPGLLSLAHLHAPQPVPRSYFALLTM